MNYYTLTVKTNQTAPLYFSKKGSLIFDESKQVAFDESVKEKIVELDRLKEHLIYLSEKFPEIYIIKPYTLEISTEFHQADLSIYSKECTYNNKIYFAKPQKNQDQIDKIEIEIHELENTIADTNNEICDLEQSVRKLEDLILNKRKQISELEVQS